MTSVPAKETDFRERGERETLCNDMKHELNNCQLNKVLAYETNTHISSLFSSFHFRRVLLMKSRMTRHAFATDSLKEQFV